MFSHFHKDAVIREGNQSQQHQLLPDTKESAINSQGTDTYTVQPKFFIRIWSEIVTAGIAKGAYHFYSTESDGNKHHKLEHFIILQLAKLK